ncbi:MAG: hypothetical protein AAF999_15130 [Pseudomonadota bacterium]
MSKTVLFVSELGGGRGYVARLCSVASIAKKLGYSTVLAKRAEAASGHIRSVGPFDRVLEGPRFPRLKYVPQIFQVAGLAATLARVGFVDHRVVSLLLAQWQELLSRVNPNIVVGDFSPYARLATLGRVPFLMIGSGYTLPSSRGLLPFPLSKSQGDPSQLVEHTLRETNKAVVSAGTNLIEDLSECLRGDWNAAATVPLLDPAVGRNPSEYFGPFEDFPPTQIKNITKTELYGYMHSVTEAECNKINALTDAGYPMHLYCDGPIDGVLNSAVMLAAPLSLNQIAGKYSVVLHQGGLGLSTFCLQAAVHQLLCPKHTEAFMTAQTLSAHGCGVEMNSLQDTRNKSDSVSEALKLLENDTKKALCHIAAETREWIENQNWKAKLEAVFASQ